MARTQGPEHFYLLDAEEAGQSDKDELLDWYNHKLTAATMHDVALATACSHAADARAPAGAPLYAPELSQAHAMGLDQALRKTYATLHHEPAHAQAQAPAPEWTGSANLAEKNRFGDKCDIAAPALAPSARPAGSSTDASPGNKERLHIIAAVKTAEGVPTLPCSENADAETHMQGGLRRCFLKRAVPRLVFRTPDGQYLWCWIERHESAVEEQGDGCYCVSIADAARARV